MAEKAANSDVVDLTRQALDAANRKDLDAVMGYCAPDAFWDMSDIALGTLEGAAAIRAFIEDWFATWDEHRNEVQALLDLGHGVVFSAVREEARLVGGKGRVEQRRGWVFLWAQGKFANVTVFLDPDDARAAAERLAEERR